MTPRRRFAVVAASALVGCAVVTGCTTDTPTPPPSGSASSDGASPQATMGSDQSDLVLGYTQEVTDQGSMTGSLYLNPGKTFTLHVGEVVAGPSSTIVTYWFSGDNQALVRVDSDNWQTSVPTLVDPVGKKKYTVTLFDQPRLGRPAGVFPNVWSATSTPQPFTVAYPVLPDSVTSVEVTLKGFTPTVTAAVTRK